MSKEKDGAAAWQSESKLEKLFDWKKDSKKTQKDRKEIEKKEKIFPLVF